MQSAATDSTPSCRLCRQPLRHTFVDLGMPPWCESFVPADKLDAMEPYYPPHVLVCGECYRGEMPWWVQPNALVSVKS